VSDVPNHSARSPHGFTRFARIAIPFAISAALFAYLFSRIDASAVGDAVTTTIALRWALPLILFNVVTLAIESHCLHRVAVASGTLLDHWTAARIKAACYLLSILNYVIGAAGLSVLLRRRAGLGFTEAASMVFLISLFDIGAVLGLAALGAGFLQSDALGIRIGLIGFMIAAILAGFLFLRVPTRIAALETLRLLDVFRAPRTAPISLLVSLGILRVIFVLCYVALTGALLWAFEIEVGPIRLGLNVAIMLAVSALPIAAGGLGTGQLVFVELYRGLAPEAELLAASLVLAFGLIASRALLGASFALEFTQEALKAASDDPET
jgi:hypothetical protein